MADNIINPNDIMGKSAQSLNDFATAEQPDGVLVEQFSGLLAGEGEGDPKDSQRNIMPPAEFKDLELNPGNMPPVQGVTGNEQVDFNENFDVFAGSASVAGAQNTGLQTESGTLGDKILQGMQGLREQVENGAREVESHLQSTDEVMSMREMFETQWTMSKLMLTEDFIGKIASKGTQAFDTLLRNQ